jgi:hypothetical protein
MPIVFMARALASNFAVSHCAKDFRPESAAGAMPSRYAYLSPTGQSPQGHPATPHYHARLQIAGCIGLFGLQKRASNTGVARAPRGRGVRLVLFLYCLIEY